MRIIAGQWKGCRIDAPEGRDTRPILDRAKTVLFDVLGHRLARPGQLPAIAVLDLFAGSGTLGLEALSRGAAYAVLVEQARSTAALIRSNLDKLKIIDEARVVETNAGRYLPTAPPEGVADQYGLVFVDPPYRLLTGPTPKRPMPELLSMLAENPLIAPDATIVVRHGRQRGTEPDLAPLVELERRDVGTMTFRFMTPPERDR